MAGFLTSSEGFNPEAKREWYEAEMGRAANMYGDVVEGLRKLEVPAEVIQTGGMCLAISWPTREGHWLLTDVEGPLPWDRETLEGWALGRYDDEGDPTSEIALIYEPTAASAVDLVVRTLVFDSD